MDTKASIPQWTCDENKRLELALVQFPEGSPSCLENIAQLMQKPLEEVKYYSRALVHSKIDLNEYPEDDYVSPPEPTQSQEQGSWTTEEHRLFLEGLKKYGNGNWMDISKVVGTRNRTQVASHAQKYFERQNPNRKKTKRSSILDMTLEDEENVSAPTESNLESTSQHPHCRDQVPPD